jgi:hypothetical protein
MTDKLTFQQTRRNGGAVHLHKWTVRSAAALVTGFRNEFLASCGFPVDQHCRIGRGHDTHDFEYALESEAVTDNAG